MNAGNTKETNKIGSPKTDTIDFSTQVQPVLQKKCSPCHFPGGKMYEKMPFDNGKTIMDHKAGIFRRITDVEEVKLFRKYVEQNKMLQ